MLHSLGFISFLLFGRANIVDSSFRNCRSWWSCYVSIMYIVLMFRSNQMLSVLALDIVRAIILEFCKLFWFYFGFLYELKRNFSTTVWQVSTAYTSQGVRSNSAQKCKRWPKWAESSKRCKNERNLSGKKWTEWAELERNKNARNERNLTRTENVRNKRMKQQK